MFPYKNMEKLDKEVEELANKLLEHEDIMAEIDEYLDKIIEKLNMIKDSQVLTLILGGIFNKLVLNTKLPIATIIGLIEAVKLELWLRTKISDPITKGMLFNYLSYKKKNK